MRFICFLLLIVCLTGCQMRLNYSDDISVDEVRSISKIAEIKPIAFTGVRVDLKRDTIVAAYPFWRWLFPNVDIGFFRMCNATMKHRFSRSIGRWNAASTLFGNWDTDVARVVEEKLKEMGYDTIPVLGSLHRANQEAMRTELAFGAKILDVRMNLCSIWDLFESQTKLIGGDAYVKIEWEIYDPLRKRIIKTITTEGIGMQDEPIETGQVSVLLSAIEDAVNNLGRTEAFYQIVSTDHYVATKNPNKYSRLEIPVDKKPFVKPINDHFNFSRRAVITVRAGFGHGSGFFINDDGYALTNAHVVGDSKSVAIVDFAGVQYMADVLRKDEERDIALIKADITRNTYLPISKNRAKVTDTVYAIGTPLAEMFKTTITKGIVSATRFWQKGELSFYQVDAEIAPGSSGGPLVDENGNVLGVAVLGYGRMDMDIGTAHAFFIPIDDALRYLNIELTKPQYPR